MRGENEAEKNISRNNEWKFPKSGDRHKFENSSSAQPERIKMKKPCPVHYSQFAEKKEKILEVTKGKWHIFYIWTIIWIIKNFSSELWRQNHFAGKKKRKETMEASRHQNNTFKVLGKQTKTCCKPEFCIQQKPFRNEGDIKRC